MLDKLIRYEFILHDAILTYDVPDGSSGSDDEKRRVIKYRQKLEKFKTDGNTGKDYYQINGAVWVYFKRHLLSRLFPQEVRNLNYTVGINKLSLINDGSSGLNNLEGYIHSFLDNFLDGPNGINTQIREFNPGSSDEELSSIMAIKLEKLEQVNSKNKWIKFILRGYPSRKDTHYYFTPLNDDFALSIEFIPSNSCSHEKGRKIIDDRNNKTIQVIMNSIEIRSD